MLTVLKKVSILKISIFLLGLNLTYIIGYLGDILIEGNYSFVADWSIIISLFYALAFPFVGYMIYRYFSTRVAWTTARVVLDDLGAFGLLSDEKLKYNPSLKSKVDKYKKEFWNIVQAIGEYDSVSMALKYNYLIVLAFGLVIVLCNSKQINIEVYTTVLTSLLILLSLITYIVSIKRKKKIQSIIKKLQVVN